MGITMGPGSLPRALAQGSTTPGNVRMGHILFGISFYLWCLFQLHCRFLMDSHFPCSFPIIQYIFPGPCRHGLSQQVSHHQQPRFGSGEGQAHPLLPHPTTHQPLGDVGSCPGPKLLGGVGSVAGFGAGGGERSYECPHVAAGASVLVKALCLGLPEASGRCLMSREHGLEL